MAGVPQNDGGSRPQDGEDGSEDAGGVMSGKPAIGKETMTDSYQAVYKWTMPAPVTEFEMPADARVIDVLVQDNVPTLWTLGTINGQVKRRTFVGFGTGHPITEQGLGSTSGQRMAWTAGWSSTSSSVGRVVSVTDTAERFKEHLLEAEVALHASARARGLRWRDLSADRPTPNDHAIGPEGGAS